MGRHEWVAREGQPFILLGLILLLLVGWAEGAGWTLIAAGLAGGVLWFYRNPEREAPTDPNIAVCPADGRVVDIQELDETRYAPGRYRRVSIFMSPFNVHVNRAPLGATVASLAYNPGRFLMASNPKASQDNEQMAYVLDTPKGRILVVQIAGAVARRIVPWVTVGDRVARNQRFGMIRFGSRVDIYLPPEWRVPLLIGQRTVAGETPLAYID